MGVEATLLIDPGGSDVSQSIIIAEPDDTLNINASGEVKTNFSPGDLFYFRIHHSSDVIITDIIPTDGSIQPLGAQSRAAEESLSFISRDSSNPPEHALRYIPSNSLQISYLGRPGSLSRITAFNGVITLQASINNVPFLSKVNYNYSCNLYVLRTPLISLGPDETYQIVIVVYTQEQQSNACSNS